MVESTLFGHEKGAFTGADRRRPGMFELADGGTLFLDEIGELSSAAQASVLRVLETGRLMRVGGSDEIEVDVRLVTATHRDLEQMCERGEFRWDLLYRLNTFVLEIPPLRDRPEEIEPLARLFLEQARARSGTGPSRIQPDAIAALAGYRWPGNVRELRNVVERAAVMAPGESITIADLPPRVRSTVPSRGEQDPESSIDGPTDSAVKVPATLAPPPPVAPPGAAGDLRGQLAEHERRLILGALQRCRWNQSEAARLLQIPRRTLTSKMRLHGIRKRYEAGS
jgi:DNA-binding NtrC family response regulator